MRSGYSTDVQDIDRRYEAPDSLLTHEQKRMIGLEPQILGGSVKQSDDLKKPLPLNDLLKHLFK
jgi:hypothetical protein